MHRIVSILLVVAIAAGGAWYLYQKHQQQMRRVGIVSENIVHDGDAWKADFVVRLPAPEKAVFGAIEHVENTRSDEVRSVKVLDQHDDSKTVVMEIAGPAGQTITTELAFKYFPAAGRITYRTVNSPALDTSAEYQLEDQGPDTVMRYHQSTRMLQNFPVPDAVVKQVIRGFFVSQLAGLRKGLDISADESADEPVDEP